jgi:uncharacterized protein (TIGR03083 family)
MNWQSYQEAIRRESADLAAAADLGLQQPVPSCPGWTVHTVVGHTGSVQRQKEQIVRERWAEAGPDLAVPPDSGLVRWFRQGTELLLETLAQTDPSTPVYSWYPADQSVGFWCRRMAHETAIHRVDAELGHGIVNPVEPVLAADGIDEILTVMMEGYPEWATPTATQDTLRIECTDQPGSWSLIFITWSGTDPESGTDYLGEPGILFEDVKKPTAVLRGAASGLDLFIWGRGPREALATEGDLALVEVLRSIAADSTG